MVAYDGSGFHGFAAQPGVVTVGGRLAEALARTVRLHEVPRLICAGRTDAGVHARGQVVHVDLPFGAAEPAGLVHSLNRQLAPAIVVGSAEPAPEGFEFDARRSARSRRYRYLVWNAPVPDPLLAPVAWHVADPLDLRAMEAASDPLLGEHDFRGFCRRVPGTGPEAPLNRRVLDVRWVELDGPGSSDGLGSSGRLLSFEIAAQSFCHQMVRSLVGALVQVGRGRGNAAWMMALLRAGDRSGSPEPAPAHGLCLMAVAY